MRRRPGRPSLFGRVQSGITAIRAIKCSVSYLDLLTHSSGIHTKVSSGAGGYEPGILGLDLVRSSLRTIRANYETQ
jgi:hypothetical protein